MRTEPVTNGEVSQAQAERALGLSEARMRALLEAAVDAIISIDAAGIMHTVNPAAERLFGYPAHEMLGRNVSMIMPAPDRDRHDDYIARYLATGQRKIIGIGREVVGLRKDGSTFPIDLSVAEGRLGSERLFVGIIRDLTGRKRAEEDLRRSKEELERTVAELQAKEEELKATTQQLWQAAKLASVGELAASIAHEVNNPLGTVSLRIESVLSRTPADDPRRRPLEIIEQEARRMADLVANLLQFSRRGADQISSVEVPQELAKSVDLVRHHLRKRQIDVVQDFAEGTPTVYADRQKLRQLFLNLLTNATDAMPQGGTLTVRSRPTPTEGGAPGVQIEIADTGAGIAPEHLERIFEPFFTTKEEGKGTGLGLAICRRVVEEHQGTIRVISETGRGTSVQILLPVKNGANVNRLRGGTRAGAGASPRAEQ